MQLHLGGSEPEPVAVHFPGDTSIEFQDRLSSGARELMLSAIGVHGYHFSNPNLNGGGLTGGMLVGAVVELSMGKEAAGDGGTAAKNHSYFC